MSTYQANIAFTSLRSSLINLPLSISSVLFNSNIPAQHVVIELIVKDKLKSRNLFVGWTGLSTSKKDGNDIVEIDSVFGTALGVQASQKVTLKIHAEPTSANRVFVDPISVADWETVETHANFLESWMVNQVRAVALGQIITVYPSPTSTASLVITNIEPRPKSGFAVISADSEVIVAPKTKNLSIPKVPSISSPRKSTSTPKKSTVNLNRLLRGIVLPNNAFNNIEDDFSLCAFTDSESAGPFNESKFVKISVLGFPGASSNPEKPNANNGVASPAQSESENEDILPIKQVIAKLMIYEDCPADHIGLSKGLSTALGLGIGTLGQIIRLESASKPLTRNSPKKLVIHPYIIQTGAKSLKLEGTQTKNNSNDKQALSKRMKSFLTEIGLFNGPICHRQQIPACEGILPHGGVIDFVNAQGWIIMTSDINIEVGDDVLRPASQSCIHFPNLLSVKPSDKPHNIVGIDDSLNSVKSAVKSGTNCLVYGSRGSGKTSVLEEIMKDLNENLVYTIWFSCGTQSEKSVQYIKDTFKKLFSEAAWYSPSVILFDDLDKVLPVEQEHAAGMSSKSRQLAELFKTGLETAQTNRYISIVASSSSKEALNSSLIAGHVLEHLLCLKNPDKDTRGTILKEALSHIDHEPIDYMETSLNIEGFQPKDIWTLVERAQHESLLDSIESDKSILLSQKHVDKAAKDFIPSNMRGVKLQKSTTSWSDIGGLKEAKSIILETLEWPTKYSPIFSTSPLRLRSGLLLYGYPGCGKTFLASAVAAECGLNFISVKGPEILNKYIGASEQSVRELFERAQAAKPCVLFFDEFDSIAPKRGHDSTGVTDRVVNQMLTQMDGAEGLEGVYVLAATSRPDLIDSALLRPGRLDKSILCDIPNTEDRLDILKAVQRKVTIGSGIDLQYLAENTEGYSGADLQALLYNAHLLAVHETLEKTETQEDTRETKEEKEVLENDKNLPKQGDKEIDDDKPLENSNGASNNPDPTNPNPSFFNLQGSMSIQTNLKIKQTLQALNNRNISTDKQEELSEKSTAVIIEPRHVEQALSETKPSISIKEQMKLNSIYKEFANGRDGNMPSGTASNEIGGRTTLM